MVTMLMPAVAEDVARAHSVPATVLRAHVTLYPLPQAARSSSGHGGWRELSCGKVASVLNLP